MNIPPVRAKFFPVDGQMDIMKLMDNFCNFVNVPKNSCYTKYTIQPHFNLAI